LIKLGGIMLDKILEYQSIDNEIVNLENSLSRSTDRIRATEIQKRLKDQHSMLVMLENNANKVNESYRKASVKYQEYLSKLEELEKQMSNADESKLSTYENAYKDFAMIASGLEKEINNIYADVLQISKEYEDIIKRSKTERANFDKYKDSYAKLKNEVEPKIEKLKTELSKKEKEVECELFKIYKHKRESRIFPVFVELASNKCSGCRMEVSASKIGQMKTNKYGIIECENCGRLIYKK